MSTRVIAPSIVVITVCLALVAQQPANQREVSGKTSVKGFDKRGKDANAQEVPKPLDKSERLRQLLASLARLEVKSGLIMPLPPPITTQEERRGLIVEMTKYPKQGYVAFDKIPVFDPNLDAIWPGAILQTESVDKGLHTPIILSRQSGTLVITCLASTYDPKPPPPLADPPQVFRYEVSQPTLGTVRDAIHAVLQRNIVESTPAKISYDQRQFTSLEQAMFSIGMSASFLGSSIKARLDSTSYEMNTNFIVNVVQGYYTVEFDYPGSPTGFFDSNVNLEVLRSLAGAKEPVYVSSVTYGRILFFIFSAQTDESSLRATVSAAVSFGLAGGSGDLKTEHKNLLERSEMRVLAVGGASSGVVDLITADKAKAITAYLKPGQDYSPKSGGQPISYTLRYLSDGSVAQISRLYDFTEKVESPIPVKAIEVQLFTETDDKDAADEVSVLAFRQDQLLRREVSADSMMKWPDQSGPKIVTLELEEKDKVLLSQRSQLALGVEKTNPSGWDFTVAAYAVLKDGRKVQILERKTTKEAYKMGKGQTYIKLPCQ